mmetsp:Transcript_94196/g.215479  ORF Transcript_94196/g.215479 Transcript_94196/m.215479 type:complete len:115 (+) Transcript_94196:313-657(+)
MCHAKWGMPVVVLGLLCPMLRQASTREVNCRVPFGAAQLGRPAGQQTTPPFSQCHPSAVGRRQASEPQRQPREGGRGPVVNRSFQFVASHLDGVCDAQCSAVFCCVSAILCPVS